MDWFQRITGFREAGYEATQARLSVEDGRLCTAEVPRGYAVGRLETPSLAQLRQRAAAARRRAQRLRVECITGDARQLHSESAYAGALFQAASQFNLLEMVGPQVTPEHGVTAYASDRTQGPACAVAAGAGTIYRNYLAEVGGLTGQRADRQIDCLADLGAALGNAQGALWTMRNGYALCTQEGLARIDGRLREATACEIDALRGLLRIGLHWDVAVTDLPLAARHLVSQAYCAALPVAYTRVTGEWERFATLVLEAAYEATLLAGLLNAQRGASRMVLLTRVGGGVFGNALPWINGAMLRALRLVADEDLDVKIVCHGSIPADLRALAASFPTPER